MVLPQMSWETQSIVWPPIFYLWLPYQLYSFHCDYILMEAASERDGLYLLIPDSKLEYDPKGVEIPGLPSASSTCHLPPVNDLDQQGLQILVSFSEILRLQIILNQMVTRDGLANTKFLLYWLNIDVFNMIRHEEWSGIWMICMYVAFQMTNILSHSVDNPDKVQLEGQCRTLSGTLNLYHSCSTLNNQTPVSKTSSSGGAFASSPSEISRIPLIQDQV